MSTALERRIYGIKTTALMRAREYMGSVELVNWWTRFLRETLNAERFDELDESLQAQILEWEANSYTIIGTNDLNIPEKT